MAITRPTGTSRLDTNSTNRVAPGAAKISDGYILNAALPAGELNHMVGFGSDWDAWIQERTLDGTTPSRDLFFTGVDAVGASGDPGGIARLVGGVGDLAGVGGAAELIGGVGGATGGAGAAVVTGGAGTATSTPGVATVTGGIGAGGGVGGAVTVAGGAGTAGSDIGGAVTVIGGLGVGTGNGGAAIVQGGATGSSSGTGGLVTIRGGTGDGAGRIAGSVLIEGGLADNTATLGTVTVKGSSSGTTGAGGTVTIIGGDGGSVGAGGAVTVAGGVATDGVGAAVTVSGSDGVGTNRAGGALNLSAGDATGTAFGGDVTISGGAGDSGDTGASIVVGGGNSAGEAITLTGGTLGNVFVDQINGAAVGYQAGGGFLQVRANSGATANIGILSTAVSAIEFGDVADNNIGGISYSHSADRMTFTVNAAAPVRISSNGSMNIGGSSTANPFRVEGDETGNEVAFFFNDGNNTNREGIAVQCGEDTESGTNVYFGALDGNGTVTGELQSIAGVFQLVNLSDPRLKDDIAPTKIDGLAICQAIDPIEYRFKNGGPSATLHPIGLNADNVESAFPSMVSERPEYRRVYKDAVFDQETGEELEPATHERVYTGNKVKMTNQAALVPVLVKAIKQLAARLETLEAAP